MRLKREELEVKKTCTTLVEVAVALALVWFAGYVGSFLILGVAWCLHKIFYKPIQIMEADDKELQEAKKFALEYAKQRREKAFDRKAIKAENQSMEEVRAFWAL
jgi:hypothetical protein